MIVIEIQDPREVYIPLTRDELTVLLCSIGMAETADASPRDKEFLASLSRKIRAGFARQPCFIV